MRIMKVLLICIVATLAVMGCSKKMAAPEAAAPAAAQTQEMTKSDKATAAAKMEEVTLNLTGVT